MEIQVWVLSTCIPDDNEPCIPTVFGSAAAADKAFAEMMQAEWESNAPEDEETCEPLPYPGDDHALAHEVMQRNPE